MTDEPNQLPSESSSSDENAILGGIAAAGIAIGGIFAVKKFFDWASTSATPAAHDTADTHFRHGMAYDAQGDVKNAVREYYECLRRDSNHANAHNSVAWLLATRSLQLDRALFHATQATKLAPNHAAFLDTLAEVYLARGDLGSCIRTSQIAFQFVHPTDTTSQFSLHLRMGRVLQLQQQHREAVSALLSAASLGVTNPPYDMASVFYGLAVSYANLEDYGNALATIERAEAIRPHPGFTELKNHLLRKAPAMDNPFGPLVFISYCSVDVEEATALANRLAKEGFEPWLDKFKLLPGDNYEREIRNAVKHCVAFVVCLCPRFNSGGYRQREVRWAFDALQSRPIGDDFVIPYVIEPCEFADLPEWIDAEKIHVDLSKKTDIDKLVAKLRKIAEHDSLQSRRPRKKKG